MSRACQPSSAPTGSRSGSSSRVSSRIDSTSPLAGVGLDVFGDAAAGIAEQRLAHEGGRADRPLDVDQRGVGPKGMGGGSRRRPLRIEAGAFVKRQRVDDRSDVGKAFGALEQGARERERARLGFGAALHVLDRQEVGDLGVADDPADGLDREVADRVAEDRLDVGLAGTFRAARGRRGRRNGQEAGRRPTRPTPARSRESAGGRSARSGRCRRRWRRDRRRSPRARRRGRAWRTRP